MAAYFGTSPYNSVGLNQLVSDLYQVSLRVESSEIQDLGRLHEPNRPGKASFPARWSFFHRPNSVDCLQTFFPLQGLSVETLLSVIPCLVLHVQRKRLE